MEVITQEQVKVEYICPICQTKYTDEKKANVCLKACSKEQQLDNVLKGNKTLLKEFTKKPSPQKFYQVFNNLFGDYLKHEGVESISIEDFDIACDLVHSYRNRTVERELTPYVAFRGFSYVLSIKVKPDYFHDDFINRNSDTNELENQAKYLWYYKLCKISQSKEVPFCFSDSTAKYNEDSIVLKLFIDMDTIHSHYGTITPLENKFIETVRQVNKKHWSKLSGLRDKFMEKEKNKAYEEDDAIKIIQESIQKEKDEINKIDEKIEALKLQRKQHYSKKEEKEVEVRNLESQKFEKVKEKVASLIKNNNKITVNSYYNAMSAEVKKMLQSNFNFKTQKELNVATRKIVSKFKNYERLKESGHDVILDKVSFGQLEYSDFGRIVKVVEDLQKNDIELLLKRVD